jgi:hypothetical protein
MPSVLLFRSAKWLRAEIVPVPGTAIAVASRERFSGNAGAGPAKETIFLKSAVDVLLKIIY